ncbi:RAD55 family ATPase [Halorhabdus amylolytica]|uniref:RAD55 family ATPase n=1 Tax=Halorhabdus amylolytica TaxID=2559573 RepID=UPI0010A9AD03|nr:HTR-like protein [Halorhabdus amylolytica]
MERIPFGIQRMDSLVNGGAPRGTVVLLSGESGAGAREFMYTSATINGLASVDPERHDLYYGDLASDASLPEEIHYVSFTADKSQFEWELAQTLEEDIVEAGLKAITFQDLSTDFFHVSPLPRDWYADRTPSVKDLRSRTDREGLLSAFGDLMSEHAADNLVVIDSLSDLISAAEEEVSWSDVTYILKGLQKAAHRWNGLVLAHVNHETLSPERHGQLVDAVNGTMRFEWETGGSTRARTLVVKQFRGVLSALEDENIVRFETEIDDDGFDISDVRKIR